MNRRHDIDPAAVLLIAGWILLIVACIIGTLK